MRAHNLCLSKNKKNIRIFHLKIIFYNHEKSQCIAYACFRNKYTESRASVIAMGCNDQEEAPKFYKIENIVNLIC